MKTKRKSIDEKLQLIMECRNSGLSDYQWCKRHDINSSTFYNWVTRIHKQVTKIPEALSDEKKPPLKQEVVKLELVHKDATLPIKSNENIRALECPTSTEHPAVEM
ncbi:IS66 family insertion sequence element accessory protein TnpA [Lachnoclostridium sp.]|uniref:IS66 family insertion sequence element accessory protein TnpA n=1 Tax=Lachnoclostridium sp. TaxID=2028282 RepID=UPI00289BF5F6|nr:IS66 family insertion sequence element accessory protein TnpB [Lachnoclostridium sp.]